MAVPTQLSDLYATAASNSPAGTDTVGTTMDDFLRAHASIIARISAGTDALATPALGTPASGIVTNLTGTASININGTVGATTPAAGTFVALTATGAFTSLGIDDNATAKALTLSGSGANSLTIANSATSPTIGTTAGGLKLTPAASGETSHVQIVANTGAATPVLSSTLGLVVGANYSNGPGETNFYNPFYTATASFDFRQITASGTSASIARMIPVSGGTAGLVFVQGSGSTNARIGTEAASNIIIGSGTALSTSATTNHMMIPTCAGTPTGIPVDAAPGRLPLIYDTTNNFLYVYNDGWKKSAAYA